MTGRTGRTSSAGRPSRPGALGDGNANRQGRWPLKRSRTARQGVTADRPDRDPPSLNASRGSKPAGEMRRGSAESIGAGGRDLPHRRPDARLRSACPPHRNRLPRTGRRPDTIGSGCGTAAAVGAARGEPSALRAGRHFRPARSGAPRRGDTHLRLANQDGTHDPGLARPWPGVPGERRQPAGPGTVQACMPRGRKARGRRGMKKLLSGAVALAVAGMLARQRRTRPIQIEHQGWAAISPLV